MDGGCYNASFDAEGVPKHECVLVESGELKNYLHNTYSARKMGAAPTANAVRSSYRSLPVPGPTNLYVVPGERDVSSMIADLDEGVYVQDIMGMHTADPISGDFSVGINGWHVRSGSCRKPIVEMTMSGNISDFLGGIREVGSEIVYIGSYGAPPVLVEGLSVSGT
jgi:PmbA protein